MKATVQHRQSVFDLALLYFGTVDAAFLVAEKLGCSVTDLVNAGTAFEYSTSEIQDKRVTEYYEKNQITPATALEEDDREGIGSWAIEVDFIIS